MHAHIAHKSTPTPSTEYPRVLVEVYSYTPKYYEYSPTNTRSFTCLQATLLLRVFSLVDNLVDTVFSVFCFLREVWFS